MGAEPWSRFRGPNGTGVSGDRGFPLKFGKSENLVWRTPVRPGKSSPVLSERHVFLTGAEGTKLYTQCFDRETGKLLWEREEERARSPIGNALNHAAAISAATDGSNVYVFFKDYGMISYDALGKPRWRVPLGPFNTSMGLGSSPVVAGGSVMIVADQLDGSFAAAFDARNGEMKWKTARGETEGWGSPFVLGKHLITASRGQFGAYDLASGKRVATHEGMGSAIVASPAFENGMMYVFGYASDAPSPFTTRLSKFDRNNDGQLTADEYGEDPFVHAIARYRGNRDMVVTKDEWDARQVEIGGATSLTGLRVSQDGGKIRTEEVWRFEKGFVGVIPSPLAYQGVVYVVKNGGILMAFDGATGKQHKAGRLDGSPGGYSSSPVAAEGRVYIASEEGKISVLKAGPEWEVVQVNDLDEGCFATPALSGGSLYVRTSLALYRFGSR